MNCIHPSPDEPGFATAEMLYIDPAACVDCGACVSACPVGAIAPDTRLEPKQLQFIELNAAFYPKLPYKPAADFAAIVLVSTAPVTITANPAVPASTVLS